LIQSVFCWKIQTQKRHLIVYKNLHEIYRKIYYFDLRYLLPRYFGLSQCTYLYIVLLKKLRAFSTNAVADPLPDQKTYLMDFPSAQILGVNCSDVTKSSQHQGEKNQNRDHLRCVYINDDIINICTI
jgi:hypothetical protein